MYITPCAPNGWFRPSRFFVPCPWPLLSPTVVHVPAVPESGLHPLAGGVSQGHQATEPAAGPRDGCPQAVRLRQRQTLGPRRTQCIVHLFPLLQGPRAHIRGHWLHHKYWWVSGVVLSWDFLCLCFFPFINFCFCQVLSFSFPTLIVLIFLIFLYFQVTCGIMWQSSVESDAILLMAGVLEVVIQYPQRE